MGFIANDVHDNVNDKMRMQNIVGSIEDEPNNRTLLTADYYIIMVGL